MYGSYGLFFDTMKLEMPRGAWGGEKWVSYYYTLDTFDWPSIDCQGPNGEDGCNGGRFIESINFRHTSNEPGSEIGEIDPNLQADAEARVHDRSRSRAAARACRSASATSTRAGTRPSTTSASARRAARRAARSTTSRTPAYGIGKHADSGPVPDGAGGGQRLRRPRVRRPQALLEQLAGHVERCVQPSVWQLRRARELGRKRPDRAERQPLLRLVVPVVRPEGQ